MFKVKCTFQGEKTLEVIGGRSALWQSQDFSASLPDTDSKTGKTDYAWAYFMAKQAGKLGELGCPDGSIDDALNFLADNYDIAFEPIDDNAPLVFTPDK